ncbi:MAG: hypothetical protein IJP30_05245 [Clostridia bacterium]|nr:hypothetical protein [Clostridia bacterium]
MNQPTRRLYVLLTFTNTLVARGIRMYCKEPYSHVSLAFDENLEEMYSFARKGIYNPFNAGFSGGDYKEWARKLKEEKQVTLTFTLENAASAYELLDIKKNQTLLDSMIYDCLKMRQSQILAGMKGKENEPI